MQQIGLGAIPSKKDPRTVKHNEMLTFAGVIQEKGGHEYSPSEIENQHRVGICTAISMVQNAEKAIGRKFSPDFHYLIQKKYIDKDPYEGSSVLSALKAGKKFGFLPIEEFPYVTEKDRELPFKQYMDKMWSLSETEVQRLIKLCADYKLDGYASVEINPDAIASAIQSSRSGIIVRYGVGSEWWTAPDGRVSWKPEDINPLKLPTGKSYVSGHAIIDAKWDYSSSARFNELVNTWGTEWCKGGKADVLLNYYDPTEAWIPYYGMTEEQIQELKAKLEKKLSILQQMVLAYQKVVELMKQIKNN